MAHVIADITISLDGFVTARDPDIEHGLGVGGEVLHRWAFEGNVDDQRIIHESTEQTGAVVMGRRLFDIVDAPGGWNDEVGYGAGEAATTPVYVVTHHQPEQVRLAQMHIVTDGLESAVRQAGQTAGDRPVVIMGGAEVIREALAAGLVDELRVHIAPVLLGGGTPLFGDQWLDLELVSAVSTPLAQHLVYRVTRRV